MDDKVWNEGEPPHIGWWLTKDRNNVQRWCWWDGNFFLYYAQALGNLLWSDYYPEGARVPRVDPSLPGSGGVVAYINASKDGKDMWARAAWVMYHRLQAQADAAAAGSTRTVREMKERVRCPEALRFIPLDKPTKEEWNRWAQGAPRLSDSVRVNDADFSGAMQRNTDPDISRLGRRDDPSGAYTQLRGRVVSNGQPPVQNPERRELASYNSLELTKELFRRFNATP